MIQWQVQWPTHHYCPYLDVPFQLWKTFHKFSFKQRFTRTVPTKIFGRIDFHWSVWTFLVWTSSAIHNSSFLPTVSKEIFTASLQQGKYAEWRKIHKFQSNNEYDCVSVLGMNIKICSILFNILGLLWKLAVWPLTYAAAVPLLRSSFCQEDEHRNCVGRDQQPVLLEDFKSME